MRHLGKSGEMSEIDRETWAGRKVLVTGDTGFTGVWLCRVLMDCGAEVAGYSLAPNEDKNREDFPSSRNRIGRQTDSSISAFGDIQNYQEFENFAKNFDPEVVIHLAAEAQVLEGYRSPLKSFSVNMTGTLNLLEVVRHLPRTRVTLVVTTDKVYRQTVGIRRPFVEDDPLWGSDPYSASKVCAEQIVDSYRKSFFAGGSNQVVVARAGNIIGGGDWSRDRLLPDLVRSRVSGVPCEIRMPFAIRPWGHVADVIGGYLHAIGILLRGGKPIDTLNLGPRAGNWTDVQQVIEIVRGLIPGIPEPIIESVGPVWREEPYLDLDVNKAGRVLRYSYAWSPPEAINRAANWYRDYLEGQDGVDLIHRDLREHPSFAGLIDAA